MIDHKLLLVMRFLSFFIYLNDVEEGGVGKTEFVDFYKPGTHIPFQIKVNLREDDC